MSGLAYVLATFPTVTETFIVGEVLELRRRGVRIELFALRRAAPAGQPDADALASETTYSPGLLSPGLLVRNLRAALRDPRRYFGTLALTIRQTWANPVLLAKSLVLFPKAVVLGDEVRERGLTHIHAHWATYPSTVALIASALSGRPWSFTAHAWDVSMIRTFLREKVRRARFVVTCTAENQRDLASLVPPDHAPKVLLNHHGVSLDRVVPLAERPAGGEPRIVTCGALYERKGIADLVRACAILHASGVRFSCTIIGDGPQRRTLAELIAASGLEGRVHLAGAMAHGEVMRHYANADVFVLPCLARAVRALDHEADILKSLEAWFEGPASVIKDGIPNVLVEAMAVGLPVVSTVTGGIPELIEHGDNGLLVPARDPDALAREMRTLLEDPELRRRLGRRAQETVRADFDRRRTVAELVDIFANHLDQPLARDRREPAALV